MSRSLLSDGSVRPRSFNHFLISGLSMDSNKFLNIISHFLWLRAGAIDVSTPARTAVNRVTRLFVGLPVMSATTIPIARTTSIKLNALKTTEDSPLSIMEIHPSHVVTSCDFCACRSLDFTSSSDNGLSFLCFMGQTVSC